VSSHPLDAVNLAVDRSDNLLVLSSAGFDASVYSLKPDGPDGTLTRIEAEPAGTHPDAAIALPVDWWVNGEFKTSTILPATNSRQWRSCSPRCRNGACPPICLT